MTEGSAAQWLGEVLRDERGWIVASAVVTWLWVGVAAALRQMRTHRRQQEMFVESLTTSAIERYLYQWAPQLKKSERTRDALVAHLGRTVPWRWFTSLVFAVLAASTIALLASYSLDHVEGLREPWLSHTAAAALAGGFMWVVLDQLLRQRRRDYTQDDVGSHCLRLLVSIPMGLALSELANEAVAPGIAFLLGAFPTTTLLIMARRTVDRRIKLGDVADDGHHLDLQRLQGVGRPEAERFAEEGIRSLLQLAYTDPFLLAVRTNFDFDYVSDLVSQALLWTYATDGSLEAVQKLGLRGVIEAQHLKAQLDAKAQGAQEILIAGAAAAGVSVPAFENILVELEDDPYAEFICALWDEEDDDAS
jgi:hypothetical protein